MNEVKIQIPDNCELIKDGDTYIVKEKNQIPPKSWEEFCERYPIQKGETYIDLNSGINVSNYECNRNVSKNKNWCTSKEEAKAFLALMQLRQLRKAWVGDWDFVASPLLSCHAVVYTKGSGLRVRETSSNRPMSFPTMDMAENFLGYFRNLCETAKILL